MYVFVIGKDMLFHLQNGKHDTYVHPLKIVHWARRSCKVSGREKSTTNPRVWFSFDFHVNFCRAGATIGPS